MRQSDFSGSGGSSIKVELTFRSASRLHLQIPRAFSPLHRSGLKPSPRGGVDAALKAPLYPNLADIARRGSSGFQSRWRLGQVLRARKCLELPPEPQRASIRVLRRFHPLAPQKEPWLPREP